MKVAVAIVLVASGVSFAGCDSFCEECSGWAPPVTGTRAAFQPADTSIGGLESCGSGVEAVARVRSSGTVTLAGSCAAAAGCLSWADFQAESLGPALAAARVRPHRGEVGLVCGGPPGILLVVDDWSELDRLARVTADTLRAEDLAGEVLVGVGPELVLCPQVACGY